MQNVSNDSLVEDPAELMAQPATPAAPVSTANEQGNDRCIVKRSDGVYVDAGVLGATFETAVNNLFCTHAYFAGLNYAVFLKVMFGHGPDLPRAVNGETMIRFAADIVPFTPERRELYRAVKISDGNAEYYFEPVFLRNQNDPQGGDLPAMLDVDEFISDLWVKGIRFGVKVAAVRAAMLPGKSERVTVAQRLDPVLGVDAHIVEVSEDIHRSDAPRQLANGKLDLMAFQNRFPQIKKGMRLLKKVPRKAGVHGFELSGMIIEPPIPTDIELGKLAGPGTVIESSAAGEFLVSLQAGFLAVDGKTQQISVGDKIVSRDGVSARTTGNLQLTGDYEEYGEVQEKRLIEGDSILLHADVFGNIVSRGGTIMLDSNLVGGTAHNANGDICVRGVISGSVVQTKHGTVTLHRAESCVISGTRVQIDHASNCEIIADEVFITTAEGCAIAGRRIVLESAGPRKQSEMAIYALVPDSATIDAQLAELNAKVEACAQGIVKRQGDMDALTNLPEVRQYMTLATKIRKKEMTLTPEQEPQFQKMLVAVGPTLKAIGALSNDVKTLGVGKQAILDMVSQVVRQKNEVAGEGYVKVSMVNGDTLASSMKFHPDGSSLFDLTPKDIKAKLRRVDTPGDVIFSGDCGAIDWKLV